MFRQAAFKVSKATRSRVLLRPAAAAVLSTESDNPKLSKVAKMKLDQRFE